MSTQNVEYRCKHCNRILKEGEQPCPYCGKEGRKISTVVEENISVSDSIQTKVLELSKSVDKLNELYKKYNNATNLCILIWIGLTAVLTFVFFILGSNLLIDNVYGYFDRTSLLPAIIGNLTFISIFYSLLISPQTQTILEKMGNIIKYEEDRIKNEYLTYLNNSSVDGWIEKNKSLKKSIENLATNKAWKDMDKILLLIIVLLIISLVTSLFTHPILIVISYILFIFGLTLTLSLVIFWRKIKLIYEEYENIDK